MTDSSVGSVVDFMSQPSFNHEPQDDDLPTVPLVSREKFWTDYAQRWGAILEPDPLMARMYVVLADKRVFATELDVA